MRILVVEDDILLARRIGSALTAAGHYPIIAHDGERALEAATQTSFDLIVLDILLPGVDGLEVLRRLRSQHIASRVLLESACGDVRNRVTGLQLGADDYLPKPFAMAELVARVNALGRRYPEDPMFKLYTADLTLECVNNEVYRCRRRIHLSAREVMLLKVFMLEPGRVFRRTELCERVWGHPHEYDTKLIEVFIGRLRRKMGDPPLIHTVGHVGYAISEAA